MVRLTKYMKVRCTTENNWYYAWFREGQTITCPNDSTHSIDLTLTSAVEQVKDNNDMNINLSHNIFRANEVFRIHGTNPVIGTTNEDIWNVGGFYNWTSDPSYIQVVSNNVQDGITGLGAQQVRLYGLDTNYNLFNETINLVGNGIAYSANQYQRIYEAHVSKVGTFHGSNYNNIDIGISGSGILLARIGGDGGAIDTAAYGIGTSEQAIFTIPANKTGYISRLEVISETNKVASVYMYNVQNIDSQTYSPREMVWRIDGFMGHYSLHLDSFIKVPEKTDIWFQAHADAAAVITVDFDIYLVNN